MKRGQSSPSKNAKKAKENPEDKADPTQHHVKIDTDSLKKVTVFEDRAELKREFTVDLEPGLNEVNFERISDSLIADSLRVTGKGDAVIEEVQVADRRVTEGTAESARAMKLRAEKDAISARQKAYTIEKASLEKRIAALDTMIEKVVCGIGAPTNGIFTADNKTFQNVTSFFDFYDKQATEASSSSNNGLREKLSLLEDTNKNIVEEYCTNNHELSKIESKEKIKLVSVLLDSTKGGNVSLALSYQVKNAWWRPTYDVRVDTKDGKTEMQASELSHLSYFGNVSQNSGEDWEGAQLTLSTARPCKSGTIPDLNTLDVIIPKPQPPITSRRSRPRGMDFNLDDVEFDGDSDDDDDEYDDGLDCAEPMKNREAWVNKQTLSTEFAIVRPCSIPSDDAEHKVTIGIITLEPQLVHVSVPSKNACAFLTASAINTSSLPLLNGQASVYLDGAFVAKTKINAVSPGERFTASLGVDPAVKIEYKPAHKHHEQTGMFTKLSTTVTEQKIVVRNTRGDAVLLTIREQIPRTTDEKIKVNLISPSSVEKVGDDYLVCEIQTPKEGANLLPSNNLEWTVKMDKNGDVKSEVPSASDLRAYKYIVYYYIDEEADDILTFCSGCGDWDWWNQRRVYGSLEFDKTKRFQVWRMWTTQFAHDGFDHLLDNIFVQCLVGIPLEMEQGSRRVSLIYTLGVISPHLLEYSLDPTYESVGASSGGAALIVAYLINVFLSLPKHEFSFMRFVTVLICLFIFLCQFFVENIKTSHIGHSTGAFTGLIVGFVVMEFHTTSKWLMILRKISAGIYFIFVVATVLILIVQPPTARPLWPLRRF